MRKHSSRRAAVTALAGIIALSTGLVGCAGGATGPAEETFTDSDIDNALEEGGSLLVWGWDASLPFIADAFMAEYPNVNVTVENVGNGFDTNQKLERAFIAGEGAPDVSYMNFSHSPQYAVSGDLDNLSRFGLDSLKDRFGPSYWTQNVINGKLYGIPSIGGPMTYWYNEAIFNEYGLEVPETWDDLLEQGKLLREQAPDIYMADGGDGNWTVSLLWQAGAKPFQVDGDTVTIDLTDEIAERVATRFDNFLEADVLAPWPTFSEDWFAGIAQGRVASLLSGGWMGSVLEGSVPEQSGQWKVALAPVETAGSPAAGAEVGGAGYVMTEQTDNELLAAGFLRFLSTSGGTSGVLEINSIPTTIAALESADWQSQENPFFGGQNVNAVVAEASASVVQDWQWTPFHAYAEKIQPDTVGQAFVNRTGVLEGLAAFEADLRDYAVKQGFKLAE